MLEKEPYYALYKLIIYVLWTQVWVLFQKYDILGIFIDF